MNILHYSLGLPPYRSGGLTKYSLDLMLMQCSIGHDVSLLYPSGMTLPYPKMKIRKHEDFNRIHIYELKNPLPVPLLHGVGDPEKLCNESGYDEKVFKSILDMISPEVLHVHTLMGLPKSFLQLCKSSSIKIVYTSHDYYGLCLKANLIDSKNKYCLGPNANKCYVCNAVSPSTVFLRLRNEPFILSLKKQLHKKVKNENISMKLISKEPSTSVELVNDYGQLLNYYRKMIEMIDMVHFNSTVAKSIYKSFFTIHQSKVIPITHAEIEDHRTKKDYSHTILRLGFIGHTTTYKGFPVLKQQLLKLYNEGAKDWSLNVWGGAQGTDPDCSLISYRGLFNSQQLADVYSEMDLLIVPSVWKETFSLITLEALSYGVPVLVSSNVGAQDIVKEYDENFVYRSEEELFCLISSLLLERTALQTYSQKIMLSVWNHSLERHARKIIETLYL